MAQGGTRIMVEAIRFNWQTGPMKDPRICALNVRYDHDKMTRVPEWQARAMLAVRSPGKSKLPPASELGGGEDPTLSNLSQLAKRSSADGGLSKPVDSWAAPSVAYPRSHPGEASAAPKIPTATVHSRTSPVVYSAEDVLQGAGPRIRVRLVLEDARSGWHWICNNGGGLLGPVTPKLVYFQHGYSGEVELRLENNVIGKGGVLGVERADSVLWEWFALPKSALPMPSGKVPSPAQAHQTAAKLYFGADSSKWTSSVTQHCVLVVRRTPNAPWLQQPYSVDNPYLPWVRVLEISCNLPLQIDAGMDAAETSKAMTDIDEKLILHLCVALYPGPVQGPLFGVAYNPAGWALLPDGPEKAVQEPAIELNLLFSAIKDLKDKVASGLTDPSSMADLTGVYSACSCWQFAWILQLFGTAIGVAVNSIAIFAAPPKLPLSPVSVAKIFQVLPFVPFGYQDWFSPQEETSPDSDITGGPSLWLLPPNGQFVKFGSHVVCTVGKQAVPTNGVMPAGSRVFDITMWANRSAKIDESGKSVVDTSKWQAGDTYGLPLVGPGISGYLGRRMVNASEPLYFHHLPLPKLSKGFG